MGHPPPRIVVRNVREAEDIIEKQLIFRLAIQDAENLPDYYPEKETLLRCLKEFAPQGTFPPLAPPKPKNANTARPPAPLEKGLTTATWCSMFEKTYDFHKWNHIGNKSTR